MSWCKGKQLTSFICIGTTERIDFLRSVTQEKLNDHSQSISTAAAYFNCKCQEVRYLVEELVQQKDQTNTSKVVATEKTCKDILNACKLFLDELSTSFQASSIDVNLSTCYYLALSEYNKYSLNYNDFYCNCLRYLAGCTTECFNAMPKEVLQQYAHDLCVSALLGSTIYSFGELVRPAALCFYCLLADSPHS